MTEYVTVETANGPVRLPANMSRQEMAAALNKLQSKPSEPPKSFGERARGVGRTVLDNVVGIGEVDTPGERLGVTIRDSINAAESGARSTLATLADVPGMAFNFMGGKAADALQATGAVSPEVAGAAKDALSRGPFGTGSSVREGVNQFTGNSLNYEPQTKAGEYARTVGEFLPGAAGGFVPYALAPGVLSEAAGQATEGMEFPAGVPVIGGQPVEPYARTAAALAAPSAYNFGRRVITPNPADPARVAAANRLRDEGIDVTAGQKTGNRRLTFTEGGSPRTADIISKQDEQFTEAILRRIKARDPNTLQPAKRATPEVLRQAGDDIGQLFEEATENLTVKPLPRTIAEMDMASETYRQLTAKANIAPIIENIRTKVARALEAGKPITGQEYQQWRSQLSRASVGNDGQLSAAAKSFIQALDRAAEASMSDKSMLEKFRQARSQWRDYLAIRDAATMAGESAASGVISPQQFRGKVTAGSGKSSYATGQRDIGNLTRDANEVITRINDPQQDRMLFERAAATIGTSGAPGLLAYGLTKSPEIAAYAGGIGAMAPAIYQRTAGSAPLQAYLQNQLVTGSSAPISMGLTSAALADLLRE